MTGMVAFTLRWRLAQFLEIRWWQRYLSRRNPASYLEWKRNYWRAFLRKSGLQIPPGIAVLDAGCGPAGIFIVLDEQRVHALDPLLPEYAARLPHFSPGDYPQVRFFPQALEHFDPGLRYDLVFCLNAINHVSDLSRSLDQLAKLTRPGGQLALSVDVHHYDFLKKAFRLLPGDVLHPQQHDLKEYEAMLCARGFELEKTLLLKKEGIFSYYLLLARCG